MEAKKDVWSKNKETQSHAYRLSALAKLRIFSVDVILGSVACGAMAVSITGAKPALEWWFVLPMTVWVIYTLDHILDGRKVKTKAHNVRHLYHYIYRKRIIYFLAFAAITAGGMAFLFLDIKIIIFGLVVGCITGIYLITNKIFKNRRSPVFQKELWIALIYTAGIWGGLLTLVNFDVPIITWVLIGAFFLTALSNLVLYSVLEEREDRMDGFSSAAIRFGVRNAANFFYTIVLLSAVASITILFAQGAGIREKSAGIIIFIMDAVLFSIMYRKDFFLKKERYRIYGDGIFLLPALMFLTL